MLNDFQKQQFTAFMAVVDKNDECDISPALVNAYLNEVNQVEFIQNALYYSNKRINGLVRGTTYVANPIEFYESIRAELIGWMENYTKAVGQRSVISYVAKLLVGFDTSVGADDIGKVIYDDVSKVIYDDIGKVIYGQEANNLHYPAIATRLANFVAENAANLFYSATADIRDTSTEAVLSRVILFVNNIETSGCPDVSVDLAKVYLSEVGYEQFGRNALVSPSNNNDKVTRNADGSISALNYEESYLKEPKIFFNKYHTMATTWFKKYTESKDEASVLDYARYECRHYKGDIRTDDMAQIIYGNDIDNPAYEYVASRLMAILGLRLAENL